MKIHTCHGRGRPPVARHCRPHSGSLHLLSQIAWLCGGVYPNFLFNFGFDNCHPLVDAPACSPRCTWSASSLYDCQFPRFFGEKKSHFESILERTPPPSLFYQTKNLLFRPLCRDLGCDKISCRQLLHLTLFLLVQKSCERPETHILNY